MSTEQEAREQNSQSSDMTVETGVSDVSETAAAAQSEQREEAESTELALEKADIEIEQLGACKRLIRIRIPAEEVDRIRELQVTEFAKTAWMPGFRKGKVPPRLVFRRFRREILEDLKRFLVGKALQKLVDERQLEFVEEPELDVAALNPPEPGEEFFFEFRAEVQPDFELPNYKGLRIKRPRPEVRPELCEQRARMIAERLVEPERVDDEVRAGDRVIASIRVLRDGSVLRDLGRTTLRVLPTLRFRDAVVEQFDRALAGARVGETRLVEGKVDQDAADETLRGATVQIELKIEEIQRYPEDLLERFAEEIGAESLEDAMMQVESLLRRELDQTVQRRVRQQVMEQLLRQVEIPLDEETIKNQLEVMRRRIVRQRTLARYTPEEIERELWALRSELPAITAQALREHFVLTRIAKAEGIEVQREQLEEYLEELADVQGVSPRRLRVSCERDGTLGEIEAEILEHLAFQRVLDYCEIEDVPWEVTEEDLTGVAVDVAAVDADTAPSVTGEVATTAEGADSAPASAEPTDAESTTSESGSEQASG